MVAEPILGFGARTPNLLLGGYPGRASSGRFRPRASYSAPRLEQGNIWEDGAKLSPTATPQALLNAQPGCRAEEGDSLAHLPVLSIAPLPHSVGSGLQALHRCFLTPCPCVHSYLLPGPDPSLGKDASAPRDRALSVELSNLPSEKGQRASVEADLGCPPTDLPSPRSQLHPQATKTITF